MRKRTRNLPLATLRDREGHGTWPTFSTNMSAKTSDREREGTSVWIQKQDREVLDTAAMDIFTTTDISYRRVIRRLAADHEDVRFPRDDI